MQDVVKENHLVRVKKIDTFEGNEFSSFQCHKSHLFSLVHYKCENCLGPLNRV